MRKRLLWQNWVGRRIGVEVLFEPRDLWVGVYWDKARNSWGEDRWAVYVCLVPCLPVRMTWHAHRLPPLTRLRLWLRETLRPGDGA